VTITLHGHESRSTDDTKLDAAPYCLLDCDFFLVSPDGGIIRKSRLDFVAGSHHEKVDSKWAMTDLLFTVSIGNSHMPDTVSEFDMPYVYPYKNSKPRYYRSRC